MYNPRALSHYMLKNVHETAESSSSSQSLRRRKLLQALELPRSESSHWCKFSTFCNTTSCHGFSHLEATSKLCGKLFWASIILAFSVILCIHILSITYSVLYDPDVNSEVFYQYKPYPELPIVTLCSQSPFLKSKVSGNLLYLLVINF